MQYVASVGSIHPISGKQYEILNDAPIQEAPQWLIDWCLSQKITKEKLTVVEGGDPIPEGHRNTTLASIAGRLRQVGKMNEDEIEIVLQRLNREQCQPPLADSEVRTIAHSIGNYAIKPETQLLVDGVPIEVRAEMAKHATAQRTAQVIADLPKDAIGLTVGQIPIYPYPKEENESDETAMT